MLRIISIFCIIIILYIITVIPLQVQDEISPLIQSQTITETQEGVTVIIDRTYADTQKIAVWFTITGLDLPEGQFVGAPFIEIMPILTGYPPTAIGSMSSSIDFLESGEVNGYYDFDLEFEAPETLDLAFEVRINQVDGMPLWNVPEDYVIDGQHPDDQFLYELPYDLTFIFPVTLSPLPAQIIQVDYSEESNDLVLTIDDITLTPIIASVPLCFDMPSNEDWQPNITLTINEIEASRDGYHLETLTSAESSRCVTVDFRLPFISDAQTLTITVDGLQTSIPEIITQDRIIAAQTYLTELGIVGIYENVDSSISFEVISKPDDMNEVDANLAMYNALRDRWQGAWSLTIDLNEA